MNIGFREALAEDAYDCVVFHDVDLLPEDDRLLYRCGETPKHLSVAIDKYGYRLVSRACERVKRPPRLHLANFCALALKFVLFACARLGERRPK